MSFFPTQLECPTAKLVPGKPLQCRLRIYNPADAVNEFTVRGRHPAEDWISTDPATLALMPQSEGEIAVALLIPADASVEAGANTVELEIRSALDAYDTQTEDLIAYVELVTRWKLETHPSTQRSKGTATYTVRLVNMSNHAVTARLTAAASSDDVTLTLSPTSVEMEAFHAATAVLHVTPPPHTDAHDVPYHIDVHAQAPGTPPQANRVTLVHRSPRILWKVLLLSVAVLVACILAFAAGKSWWDSQIILERGDTGQQVAQWQVGLNATINSRLAVDGRFGSRTQQATQTFQRGVGLPVTGAVDRRTCNAMRRRISATPRPPAPPLRCFSLF